MLYTKWRKYKRFYFLKALKLKLIINYMHPFFNYLNFLDVSVVSGYKQISFLLIRENLLFGNLHCSFAQNLVHIL